MDSRINLRGCLKTKGSSVFGIILAAFRLKFQGLYTLVDITPEILSRKSAQKNPKINRTLDFKQALRHMTKVKLADKGDILPGKSIVVRSPRGKEIAIFNIDSQFYALENVCPHQGGPLGEGDIEDACVTCPWHGWQFDIKTGACVNMAGEEAAKIPIEIKEDSIYLTED